MLTDKEAQALCRDPAVGNLAKLEGHRQDLYKNYYFVKESLCERVGVCEDNEEITYYICMPKRNVEEYAVKNKNDLKGLIHQAVADVNETVKNMSLKGKE